MGYDISVDGELKIVPPLEWKDLKGNPGYRPDAKYHEMRIEVDETVTDTAEGELIRRRGISVSYGHPQSCLRHAEIERELKAIISALPKGTVLTGWLECLGEDGALWRIVVADGEITEVKPEIIWPEWMT